MADAEQPAHLFTPVAAQSIFFAPHGYAAWVLGLTLCLTHHTSGVLRKCLVQSCLRSCMLGGRDWLKDCASHGRAARAGRGINLATLRTQFWVVWRGSDLYKQRYLAAARQNSVTEPECAV